MPGGSRPARHRPLRALVATGPRLAIGTALLALLALFVLGAWHGVQADTLLEYGEPYIVSASYNLGTGGRLYAPVDHLPFLHNNYGFLVQSLLAPVLAATGPAYLPFRLLTALSTTALLAVLGLAAWRETRSGFATLLAALLPLSCGFVHPWLYLGRVDAFATLLSAAGAVFAFLRREGPARRRWPFLLFAWTAFAAKQSVVGGAGAVLLYALLRGRVREALGQGVAFVAGCAAMVGLATWATGGQFWLHAVAYNAAHDRGGLWPQGLTPLQVAAAWGPALLLGLLVVAPFARFRREGPWICWLLVSVPLSFWLVRKSGSHIHYFLEPVCAASVLVAATAAGRLAAWREAGRRTRLGAAWAIGALLALALLHGPAPSWTAGVHRSWRAVRHVRWLRTRPDPVPEAVRTRVARGDGPSLLLAKLATIAIEEGRPAIFDVADFVRLQELGLFDPEEELTPLIADRTFPVIGIPDYPPGDPRHRHFSPARLRGFIPALEEHYRRLPVRLDDPKHLHRAGFWVPRD